MTLWTGFAIGILRLVLEFMSNEGSIKVAEGGAIEYFLGINFLHFALFLFIFCSIVLMVVSKLTTPQAVKDLELVTFQRNGKSGGFQWTTDVLLTVVLIALVLILWVIFSPWGIG